MRNTADVIGGKPIAVILQSIPGVSAINHLVAFYDLLETGVGANICKCNRDHRLNVPSKARRSSR
jgi:hypothetical protein